MPGKGLHIGGARVVAVVPPVQMQPAGGPVDPQFQGVAEAGQSSRIGIAVSESNCTGGGIGLVKAGSSGRSRYARTDVGGAMAPSSRAVGAYR